MAMPVAMQAELLSLAKVSAIVAASMAYVHFTASRLRPGLPRLAAFLPVVAALPVLPLAFASVNIRGAAGFFLAWLGVFKLLLLAFGRGPLDPSIPLLSFISSAALPVKLRPATDSSARAKPPPLASRFPADLAFSAAVEVALLAALVALQRFKHQMHPWLWLVVFSFHVYLFVTLLLASAAFACAILGMELEPQFNSPHLSRSLRDFWGRRWNLMSSAILRQSVYDPVCPYVGKDAAAMLTFVVSGLMHEVLLYYLTLQVPMGAMTAYFLLHGVCVAAETWWVRHKRWWVPPPPAAALLTIAFVGVTGLWSFHYTLVKAGAEEKLLAEYAATMEFFVHVVINSGSKLS